MLHSTSLSEVTSHLKKLPPPLSRRRRKRRRRRRRRRKQGVTTALPWLQAC